MKCGVKKIILETQNQFFGPFQVIYIFIDCTAKTQMYKVPEMSSN